MMVGTVTTVYREIFALLIFRETTVHGDFAEKIFANWLVHDGTHPHCEISRKKFLRFARIREIRKNLATRKFPDIR